MPQIPGYRVLRFLGEGATGKVYLARRTSDQALVAIKRIKLDAFDPTLKREIYLMQSIGSHPNVIRLHETREIGDRLYIIMEYASNGEFFDFIGAGLRQDIALIYFRQICEGLQFIHKKHIAHRDIKLENVLIDSNYNAKLCDFGFSRFFTPGQLMRTICGSPPWVAPEILLNSGYDGTSADAWSLGVLLFAMLSAALPVCERAMDGDPYYDHLRARSFLYEPWTTIFAQPEYAHACDLVKRMLDPEPSTRITLDGIMAHPWYLGGGIVAPIPREITSYMAMQKQAGGGPTEAAGASTLLGEDAEEPFRGGLEGGARVQDDDAVFRGGEDLASPVLRGSNLAGLPVYEDVTEGATLPATTILFPAEQQSGTAALMMRLQTTLQALGFSVSPNHERHVIKAKKTMRPGAECGIRTELFRTREGRAVATVTRQLGDKMAFLGLWREFSEAMNRPQLVH